MFSRAEQPVFVWEGKCNKVSLGEKLQLAEKVKNCKLEYDTKMQTLKENIIRMRKENVMH